MALTQAERQKRWRENNPEKVKAYSTTQNQKGKERRLVNKKTVMTHYGNGNCACVKCGESRLACLSIDHIHGNGAEDRRNLGMKNQSSERFYSYLIRMDFPSGYQTLCMNCQWVKRFENNEHNRW